MTDGDPSLPQLRLDAPYNTVVFPLLWKRTGRWFQLSFPDGYCHRPVQDLPDFLMEEMEAPAPIEDITIFQLHEDRPASRLHPSDPLLGIGLHGLHRWMGSTLMAVDCTRRLKKGK